jgi:hypothetical protein
LRASASASRTRRRRRLVYFVAQGFGVFAVSAADGSLVWSTIGSFLDISIGAGGAVIATPLVQVSTLGPASSINQLLYVLDGASGALTAAIDVPFDAPYNPP